MHHPFQEVNLISPYSSLLLDNVNVTTSKKPAMSGTEYIVPYPHPLNSLPAPCRTPSVNPPRDIVTLTSKKPAMHSTEYPPPLQPTLCR